MGWIMMDSDIGHACTLNACRAAVMGVQDSNFVGYDGWKRLRSCVRCKAPNAVCVCAVCGLLDHTTRIKACCSRPGVQVPFGG